MASKFSWEDTSLQSGGDEFESRRGHMELNEIKKLLYKENPPAFLENVRKDGILYISQVGASAERSDEGITFRFRVPLTELGETIWSPRVDAKLLIRYIIN